MELFLGGFAAATGTLAFFGGIALCMWVDQRGKWRQRELESAERMKALECGQPLPDAEVAWARATGSRAWAAGLVGLLVPAFTIAATTAATIVALVRLDFIHPAPLAIGWGIAGLVSVVAVTRSLGVIREIRGPGPDGQERPAPSAQRSPTPLSQAIREKL